MKQIQTTLLILSSLILLGCASALQDNFYGETVSPDQLKVQKVYDLTNVNANEIYDRTLEWLALTFADAREVIELKDKERGKIIGNGIVKFKDYTTVNDCKFMVTIDIQEGRFRITFSNYDWVGVNYPLNKKYHVDQINSSLLALSEDLNNYIINYSDDKW